MLFYIFKRILLIILIVLVVVLLLFLLLYIVPASDIRRMPIYGDGDFLDSIYTFLNVGNNIITKYIRYCYNVFIRFDLGGIGRYRFAMAREFRIRIPNTLVLLGCGLGVTLLVGIPLGVHTAVHKDTKSDRIINAITLFFSAVPIYSIALAIALFFAVYLQLIPVISSYNQPVAYFMPTLTIVLGGVALVARTTRTSMLETLEQPYITALRSKGLKETKVIYVHAFKNAMVPLVSILSGVIAQMFCGTFVVEHFFNVPGLGTYMLRAVTGRDHTELLGCAVVVTLLLATTNVVVDIIFAFINPQIKLLYTKGKDRRVRKGAAA